MIRRVTTTSFEFELVRRGKSQTLDSELAQNRGFIKNKCY